jgi:TatA/E family protein of Tat protein translocase
MPEVVLILVVALIIFGPRKLPELGKSLGQAMSQFRRASDDFKRTWEQEVEYEKTRTSGSSSSDAGYNYESSNGADTYNPYASDTHSAGQIAASSEDAIASINNAESQIATSANKTEAVPATEKKHWI